MSPAWRRRFFLIGVLMSVVGDASRTRDLGRVVIGPGADAAVVCINCWNLLRPMRMCRVCGSCWGAISTEPLLDILLAAALAWAAHSSVAVVAAGDVVRGQGRGAPGCRVRLGARRQSWQPRSTRCWKVPPAMTRWRGGCRSATWVNRLVGCAIIVPALPYLGPLLVWVDPSNSRAVADFHTLFKPAAGRPVLPFLSPFAALLRRLVCRCGLDPGPIPRVRCICTTPHGSPVVAIGSAAREALRLAMCWRRCWSAPATPS